MIVFGYLFSYYLFMVYNSGVIAFIGFLLFKKLHLVIRVSPCIICQLPQIVNIPVVNSIFFYAVIIKILFIILSLFLIKKKFLVTILKEFIVFLFIFDIIFSLLFPFTLFLKFNYLQWYSCSIIYLYSFCNANQIKEIIPFLVNALIGLILSKYLGFNSKQIIHRLFFALISFSFYCLYWFIKL